jgi:hypothetical protein
MGLCRFRWPASHRLRTLYDSQLAVVSLFSLTVLRRDDRALSFQLNNLTGDLQTLTTLTQLQYEYITKFPSPVSPVHVLAVLPVFVHRLLQGSQNPFGGTIPPGVITPSLR